LLLVKPRPAAVESRGMALWRVDDVGAAALAVDVQAGLVLTL